MQEKTSAFIDGELGEAEIRGLLEGLNKDESASRAWRDYHLIGDAMNQRPLFSDDFMTRFSERLADEPTVIAPAAIRQRAMPRKRLVAASMAASVALVSASVWYASHSVVSDQSVVAVAAPVHVQPYDGAMAYVAAHQAAMGNPMPIRHAVILSGAESERMNPVPIAAEGGR